jgi:lipopolysaccharide transport system ATP-binding protein
MYVRLAFSVAAHLEPEIMFIDEVLSVGDQSFQQKCLERIGEIARSGRTILFVSHNLASVTALCTRALLLEHGKLVADGGTEEVVEGYLHAVRSESHADLRDRSDRRGDGRLRFVSLAVDGADGARSGSDCSIRLSYEAQSPEADLFVGIAVQGPLGEPIFLCTNRLSGDSLATAAPDGEIACTISQLPLLPGRYTINVYAEVAGVLADWIEDAAGFEVLESDVFGTGQLPPSTHGPIFVRQRWVAT